MIHLSYRMKRKGKASDRWKNTPMIKDEKKKKIIKGTEGPA